MTERIPLEKLEIMSPKELGIILLSILDDDHVDVEYVKDLLAAGAPLEAKLVDYDYTPLHLAAMWGNAELTRLFIELGANIEARDNVGKTALHLAADEGRYSVAKLLLAAGCKIDPISDGLHETPLHYSIINRHRDVSVLLMENGANVNIKECNDNSPLHLAIIYKHLETCLELLRHGADIHAKNYVDETPWDIADKHTRLKIPQLNPNYRG